MYIQGYFLILSIVSISLPTRIPSIHLNALLLVSFAVYTYRDLWPLATFNEHPVDYLSDGKLLWTKILVLGYVGLVVPLFTPRQYVPVDDNVRPSSSQLFNTDLFVYLRNPIRIRIQNKQPQ